MSHCSFVVGPNSLDMKVCKNGCWTCARHDCTFTTTAPDQANNYHPMHPQYVVEAGGGSKSTSTSLNRVCYRVNIKPSFSCIMFHLWRCNRLPFRILWARQWNSFIGQYWVLRKLPKAYFLLHPLWGLSCQWRRCWCQVWRWVLIITSLHLLCTFCMYRKCINFRWGLIFVGKHPHEN